MHQRSSLRHVDGEQKLERVDSSWGQTVAALHERTLILGCSQSNPLRIGHSELQRSFLFVNRLYDRTNFRARSGSATDQYVQNFHIIPAAAGGARRANVHVLPGQTMVGHLNFSNWVTRSSMAHSTGMASSESLAQVRFRATLSIAMSARAAPLRQDGDVSPH